MKTLKFTIGDSVIRFKVGEFENNMDLDKLLKIDYGNLTAELLTFPVVVNRFGLLAADMDAMLQEAKLDLTIYESKTKERIRNDFAEEIADPDTDRKRFTIDEVEDKLIADKKWVKKKRDFNRITKEKEFMYTVYNSAKDKSKKLDKLSTTLQPGDVDEKIIQSQLNKVYFKIQKAKITD